MAYNPINLSSVPSRRQYVFSIDELSGGLSYYDNKNDKSLRSLKNMLFENKKLVPRPAFCHKVSLEGAFHSIHEKDFHGSIVLHSGERILRFDGIECHTLAEDVPDSSSVFLRMNDRLYLFTSERKIFEVKNDFSCAEAKPYIPNVTTSRNISLTDYDVEEPVNMLTDHIRCTYDMPVDPNVVYTLPYDADADADVKTYVDGELADEYTPRRTDKNKFILHGSGRSGKKITFEYRIAGEERSEKNLDMIYSSTISFCYGGSVNDGTRAFLTGSENYPGAYFRSELLDPLYFPETACEFIGDGSETINAAVKRYEKLFFFTKNSIYAMKYEFSAESGAAFTVTQVNTEVGCDMKNTVCPIDNTPVFANSLGGIYILQSTDIFDELNVNHLSENLNGKNENGFAFSTEGAKYASCDFDRKYFVYDGKDICIWDYGKTPYSPNRDYKASEQRLSWYRFEGPAECQYIFKLSGTLYFLIGGKSPAILGFDKNCVCDTFKIASDDGTKNIVSSPICSEFVTGEFDLGTAFSEKRLLYLSFEYEILSGAGGKIKIDLYGDGKKYYTFSPSLREKSGRIKIKLPAYYADKFSAGFSIEGIAAGISGLRFIYTPVNRVKHDL